MIASSRMASCQISFIPIGIADYSTRIYEVIDIIVESGLEYNISLLSTVVKGEKSMVLELISNIYERMDSVCDFAMDVKISNLCGCKE